MLRTSGWQSCCVHGRIMPLTKPMSTVPVAHCNLGNRVRWREIARPHGSRGKRSTVSHEKNGPTRRLARSHWPAAADPCTTQGWSRGDKRHSNAYRPCARPSVIADRGQHAK